MAIPGGLVEFGPATLEGDMVEETLVQQSPTRWDEAKELCLSAMDIVLRHEAGQISTATANVQLSALSQQTDPETRALATHLSEGVTAFFVHAGYWEEQSGISQRDGAKGERDLWSLPDCS